MGMDNCWIAPPYTEYETHRDGKWYKGLAGMDPRIGEENDASFSSLYALSFLAVVASSLGVGLAFKLQCNASDVEAYVPESYSSYARSLCVYFTVALGVNFINMICFGEIRCRYHNVDAVWDLSTTPREHRIEKTSSSVWAKALYMTANYSGGFFTNVLLELVLLIRAQMMTSASGSCGPCMRCLKCFILAQVVVFLFFTGYAAYSFHRLIDKEILGGTGEENDVNEGEESGDKSQQFSAFAGLCGLIHVCTSIALVVIFVRSMCRADVPGEDGAVEKKRVVQKVTGASLVAVFSTLVCYGNLGVPFANAYHLLALDSIINDLCLIFVSFSDSDEIASQASEERHQPQDVKAVTMGARQDGN